MSGTTAQMPKRRVTVARPKSAIVKLQKVLEAHDAEAVLGSKGTKALADAIKLVESVLPLLETHEQEKKAKASAPKAASEAKATAKAKATGQASEPRSELRAEFGSMSVAELREYASANSIDLGKASTKVKIVDAIVSATATPAKKTPAKKAAAKAA